MGKRWALFVELGLLCSCASSGSGTWSFGITRAVYGAPVVDSSCHGSVRAGGHISGSGDGALLLLGILLFPVALDVVLLPVTLTHDVFWGD